MGMYDELRCEFPLPDKDNDRTYQTKSLDQLLDKYRIDSDGFLWHENYETEWHATGGFVLYGHDMGRLERKNQEWVKWPYTGNVEFYDYDAELNREIDYGAYFINGEMQSLVSYEENTILYQRRRV